MYFLLLAAFALAVLKLTGIISVGWLLVLALPLLLFIGVAGAAFLVLATFGATIYAGIFAVLFSVEGWRSLRRKARNARRRDPLPRRYH